MAAHASLGYPALLELISKDAADHENPSCASSPDCATDLASNLMASVTLRMTHRSDIIELFDEYAKTFDKAPTRLVALARQTPFSRGMVSLSQHLTKQLGYKTPELVEKVPGVPAARQLIRS